MADTIITNTPDRGQNTGDSSAVVALIALILVIAVVAGIYLYRRGIPAVPNTGGTNINVTLPAGGTGASGGTTGGTSAGGTTGGATQ